MDNTPRVLAGRYEVGELIGRGGMAEVHIGHDTRLGRTVAIKVLRSDLARDPSFLARFRREAQSAAALNHPAIVAVYDTGEDIHTDPATGSTVHVPFIVMEYVEGHTVRDILQDGAAVPIDEALEITVGVLSALEYSHHTGIIHRDIKPANVMITPTGAVKVMDFGIARAVADSAATMTQTHAVIGTAQYLSPEQARGEQVDARSDLYSTGCLLFELLTGRPPFVGDSPVAVAYQHVGQAPQRPSELAADVPEVLDRITLKALAKDRDDRYSSAAEFRSDLESALRGGNVTAPMIGAAAGAAAGYAATQAMYGDGNATQVMAPAGQSASSPWGATGTQTPRTPPEGTTPVGPDDEKGSRKGLMWALIAVGVIAVAVIVGILLMDRSAADTVEVPALRPTVTKSEAQEIIEDAGLVYSERIDESQEPEGTFTRTDPVAGTSVERGSTVQVYFSGGPNTIAVPDVAGRTEDDARRILTDAGLEVNDDVERANSARVEADHVIRTDPRQGQAVQEGDTVTLVLSTGQVSLPNLVGMSQEEAEAKLDDLNLNARILSEESDERAGTVIRQNPEQGTVNQGTTVEITVAVEREAETTQVPDVTNAPESEAEATLNGWSLNLGNVRTEASDTACQGTVISQNPQAGSQAEVGDSVDIVVSQGPGDPAACAPTGDPTDGTTDDPEG